MTKLVALNMLLLTAFILSCNPFDRNSKKAESAEVLNDPPYDALTDSITRYPDNPMFYFTRGELLTQNDFHQLAFQDYKKAWNIDPNEATAVSYVSNLFITGKEKDAVLFLEQCVKTFPENTDFQRRLSEVYLQSGKTAKALDQYNNILTKDSGNFEAWYEKGILLTQLKDTLNAIAALEKAYELQPLQLCGIYLANLYAETKNAKAVTLCDELLQKDTLGELIDAFFVKGIYFSNIGQTDEALVQFQDCIQKDWKFIEAYIEKGIILFNDKNIDEALKTFTLAAKVSNTYADAYYWMGRCFETIGETTDAKQNYIRALSLDRNFTEAREALERLE